MATDIKKFLDQAGVSTLWSQIAAEVKKVDDKAAANATAIEGHGAKIQTLETKVQALEAGTYDDTQVRGLIAANATEIGKNTAAITLLNGNAETVGSVANTANAAAAAKVAEVVANADADFDTLKEIADWILNDTTGAADMANDIAALQGLVGDKAVATQIAEAISAEGLDKYALAADLTILAGHVKALEDADYASYTEVENVVDGKIAALDLANAYDAKGAAAAAETAAKAHADGLNTAMDTRVLALEAIDHSKFETAGAAANALTEAKTYTDTEVAKIQALTTAEIEAAIASAKAQV